MNLLNNNENTQIYHTIDTIINYIVKYKESKNISILSSELNINKQDLFYILKSYNIIHLIYRNNIFCIEINNSLLNNMTIIDNSIKKNNLNTNSEIISSTVTNIQNNHTALDPDEDIDDLLNWNPYGMKNTFDKMKLPDTDIEIEIKDLVAEKKKRDAEAEIRHKIFREIEEIGPPILIVQQTNIKIQYYYNIFTEDYLINTNNKTLDLKQLWTLSKEELLNIAFFNTTHSFDAFMKIHEDKFNWNLIKDKLKLFGYDGNLHETTEELKYTDEFLNRFNAILQLINNSVTTNNAEEIFMFVFNLYKDKNLNFLNEYVKIIETCCLAKKDSLLELVIDDLDTNDNLLKIINFLLSREKILQDMYCEFYLYKNWTTYDLIKLIDIISNSLENKLSDITEENINIIYISFNLLTILYVYWNSEFITMDLIKSFENLEIIIKKISNNYAHLKLRVAEILGAMKLMIKNDEYKIKQGYLYKN